MTKLTVGANVIATPKGERELRRITAGKSYPVVLSTKPNKHIPSDGMGIINDDAVVTTDGSIANWLSKGYFKLEKKAKRTISEHAHVAKLIRADLKAHNIKAKVKANSYSGGSSVTATVFDQAPWVLEAIKSETNKYQYGTFDGMCDMYNADNLREDLPQVKYLFVEVQFSDEIKQEAWDKIRAYHPNLDLPVDFKDAPTVFPYDVSNFTLGTIYSKELVRQCLRNTERYVPLPKFWSKPVKVIPAVSGK